LINSPRLRTAVTLSWETSQCKTDGQTEGRTDTRRQHIPREHSVTR